MQCSNLCTAYIDPHLPYTLLYYATLHYTMLWCRHWLSLHAQCATYQCPDTPHLLLLEKVLVMFPFIEPLLQHSAELHTVTGARHIYMCTETQQIYSYTGNYARSLQNHSTMAIQTLLTERIQQLLRRAPVSTLTVCYSVCA